MKVYGPSSSEGLDSRNDMAQVTACDSCILLANDTEACAFRANFCSRHYCLVWTGPYQMTVPACASSKD